MTRVCPRTVAIAFLVVSGGSLAARADTPVVDLSGYRADSGVTVEQKDGRLRVSWAVERPSRGVEIRGHLELDLRPDRPLIEAIRIGDSRLPSLAILENLDPVTYLLVGSRQAPAGRPPEMSVFNVFFDSPAKRPFQTYRSKLDLKHVRVTSQGHRATVAIGELTVGPFSGELRFTIYRVLASVHVETVVHTQEDRRAILYDTGLALSRRRARSSASPGWTPKGSSIARSRPRTPADRHLAVRHRTLIAETMVGSIACFPPPHQFFFPRDLTDNLQHGLVWRGPPRAR